MLILDIIILILLIWFCIKGFTKGFIIELASLVALILGIYVAYFFSNITASFLKDTLNFTSKYLHPISFLLTFIIVVIAVFVLAKLLEKLVKTASLGLLNKLFGAAFGLIKIALICGFLLYQFSIFDFQNKIITEETKNKSYTYKPLIKLSVSVVPLIKNIKEKISNTLSNDKSEERASKN